MTDHAVYVFAVGGYDRRTVLVQATSEEEARGKLYDTKYRFNTGLKCRGTVGEVLQAGGPDDSGNYVVDPTDVEPNHE